MAGEVVLRCEGLSRVYGSGETAVHALRGASLTVSAGELVVLRGPSGSGKTTLLNLLGGLETATSGQVWLGDREITGAPESELVEVRRHELGYIFQSFALLPVLSAAENVEVPLLLLPLSRAERRAKVATALEAVGLSDRAHHLPRALSGGQQQRVAVARALVAAPDLVLADEPTGNLDETAADAILALLSTLHRRFGQTFVMVTHDPRAAATAERVVRLDKGRIHADERRAASAAGGAS